MNRRKREKMIAIRDLDDYFKKDEILDISHYGYGFTIHEITNKYKYGFIIPAIRCELLGDVYDYFISLEDWREQQIKTVLDD